MLSGTATLINPLNNRTRMLRYFNGNSILYFSVPHQQANGQLQIKHKNKLKKKHIIMLNKKYKKKSQYYCKQNLQLMHIQQRHSIRNQQESKISQLLSKNANAQDRVYAGPNKSCRILTSDSSKLHFNTVLPPMPRSLKRSFPFTFYNTNFFIHFSSFPFLLHMPPISSFFIRSLQ